MLRNWCIKIIFNSHTHIFVVGLPASGKSTFCDLFLNRYDYFTYATDLEALNELADLNDSKSRLIDVDQYKYWGDIVRSNPNNKFDDIYKVGRDSSGCLSLFSPIVWDEALRRTYLACKKEEFLIFEFSRGPDKCYKSEFNLQDSDIYPHCFELLENESDKFVNKIIVHLNCPHNLCVDRNARRRKLGHSLSDRVMETSYAYDPFTLKNSSKEGAFEMLKPSKKWLYISCETSNSDPLVLCDQIISFLSDQVF